MVRVGGRLLLRPLGVALVAPLVACLQSPPDRADPSCQDGTAIAEGAEVFATICAACHKPDGTGLVGPSLVDPYWKYGQSDAELFETVSAGRPLGMPPWGPQLGDDKIWKVLAYLETLPRQSQPGVGAPDYVPPPAAAPAAAGGS